MRLLPICPTLHPPFNPLPPSPPSSRGLMTVLPHCKIYIWGPVFVPFCPRCLHKNFQCKSDFRCISVAVQRFNKKLYRRAVSVLRERNYDICDAQSLIVGQRSARENPRLDKWFLCSLVKPRALPVSYQCNPDVTDSSEFSDVTLGSVPFQKSHSQAELARPNNHKTNFRPI